MMVIPTQQYWSGHGPWVHLTIWTYSGRNQTQTTAMDSSPHTHPPSQEDQSLYSRVSSDVRTVVLERANKSTVGTWAYDSRLSGRQKHLPVAASLMCASGLDSELITLARRFLENSDLPDAVETGREMLGPDPAKRDLSLNPPIYDFNRVDSIIFAGRPCSRALDCTHSGET